MAAMYCASIGLQPTWGSVVCGAGISNFELGEAGGGDMNWAARGAKYVTVKTKR